MCSPFWGFAGAGTFVAFVMAIARIHPGFQILGSVLLSGCAGFGLPFVWFCGLVVVEIVRDL